MEQSPLNPEHEYTKSAITYLQFDRYYENMYKEHLARRERYGVEIQPSPLLDSNFIPRIAILESKLLKAVSEERKHELIEEFRRKEHEYLRFKRTKLSPDDFITLQVIGKGAFGTVITRMALSFRSS